MNRDDRRAARAERRALRAARGAAAPRNGFWDFASVTIGVIVVLAGLAFLVGSLLYYVIVFTDLAL